MIDPQLDPAVVRWSAPPEARAGRAVIVLLHGYGSDEHDLFGLVPHLPDDAVYASVRAPLAPPWPMPGHSWYPIEGLDGRSSESVTAAARGVLAWLASEAIDVAGLLGFSQGGAVSLQALRLDPARVRFAVNLSGYAAPGALPDDAALAQRKPPVFWGRGSLDEVIPAPLVAHTVEWLPGHAELSGRVYAGLGHAVSGEELADVHTFLRKQLD